MYKVAVFPDLIRVLVKNNDVVGISCVRNSFFVKYPVKL